MNVFQRKNLFYIQQKKNNKVLICTCYLEKLKLTFDDDINQGFFSLFLISTILKSHQYLYASRLKIFQHKILTQNGHQI